MSYMVSIKIPLEETQMKYLRKGLVHSGDEVSPKYGFHKIKSRDFFLGGKVKESTHSMIL